jgi:hypothetical protein
MSETSKNQQRLFPITTTGSKMAQLPLKIDLLAYLQARVGKLSPSCRYECSSGAATHEMGPGHPGATCVSLFVWNLDSLTFLPKHSLDCLVGVGAPEPGSNRIHDNSGGVGANCVHTRRLRSREPMPHDDQHSNLLSRHIRGPKYSSLNHPPSQHTIAMAEGARL